MNLSTTSAPSFITVLTPKVRSLLEENKAKLIGSVNGPIRLLLIGQAYPNILENVPTLLQVYLEAVTTTLKQKPLNETLALLVNPDPQAFSQLFSANFALALQDYHPDLMDHSTGFLAKPSTWILLKVLEIKPDVILIPMTQALLDELKTEGPVAIWNFLSSNFKARS
jgi:hypothetical protein